MLRWRKVATIIRREYLIRVRTKAFWISTVAVPVDDGRRSWCCRR